MSTSSGLKRRRWQVKGVVQGVGFRPWIHALALRYGLTGLVGNDAAGVFFEAQGPGDVLDAFARAWRTQPPPMARIDAVAVLELTPRPESGFVIVASNRAMAPRVMPTTDVGICATCVQELFDPANRRFRYPFIACNDCGPRFTIQAEVPYDRQHTSMSAFPLCAACQEEYNSPANRRFHNQGICCPECGPRFWLQSSKPSEPSDPAVWTSARQLLAAGGILAIKGLGGFHLVCAAWQPEAVQRLRCRKKRGQKPLAVMVRDRAGVCRLAVAGQLELELLESPTRPIVILPTTEEGQALAAIVAPGLHRLGCMLPYAPWHWLVLEDQPLVVTSGNISAETLVAGNNEALERLSSVADAFLFHDREIVQACDDSVLQVVNEQVQVWRRARGLAPNPVRLSREMRPVLAVGGDLKGSFCLTRQDEAFLSPHLGDWQAYETQRFAERTLAHFLKLVDVNPVSVVVDAHPAYYSTAWGIRWAKPRALPVTQVQHHQAHIAALLAEHQWQAPQSVLGVCFDGTGFGSDGAIWGGEFLLLHEGRWSRWAHFEYVPLPGGDAAVRWPLRSALAYLAAASLPWEDDLPCVQATSPAERGALSAMCARSTTCVATSSVGRLFDAVAALLGVRQEANYEAQAAVELEELARLVDPDDAQRYATLQFGILGSRPSLVDVRSFIRQLIAQWRRGIPRELLAASFHIALAELVVAVASGTRQDLAVNRVGLSGGCFQNSLLTVLTTQRLQAAGFEVWVHQQVPTNDGGLALGQAVLAGGLIPREWALA
jgi:hydrogenase maturation protein HypF